VHRATGQNIVYSQTTGNKNRGGKISFIVKALHDSIIIFAGLRKEMPFIKMSCSSMSFYIFADTQITKMTG
jgi:hypothetical protein